MKVDNTQKDVEKNSILFKRLILTFHTAAMQQMGKIQHPASGKIVRNLAEASLSINTLDMLKERCHGNLTSDEQKLLDNMISELKLNYVDECNRATTGDRKQVNNGAEF